MNRTANKGAIAAVGAVIIAALALRIICFKGFVGLDDYEYARIAWDILNGQFDFTAYKGAAVFPQRLGIIAPTVLFFTAFGVGEWVMALNSILISLVGVLLAYMAASYFFGKRAGVIASIIWAVAPIELNNATKLLPDLPSAFFASAGVMAVLAAWGSGTERRGVLFAVGFAAGAFFGVSWLCKESLTYLAPFCALLCVSMAVKNPSRGLTLWAGVAASAAGILVAEMVFYKWMTGDLMFRLHQVERNYEQFRNNGFFTEGSKYGWKPGESYSSALFNRLFVTGPSTLFMNAHYLYTGIAGLAAAAWGLFKKDRRFLIPAVWLITVALMYNFSSSSTKAYLPLALQHRYVYLIFLPGVILTSGLIVSAFSPGSSGARGTVVKLACAAFVMLMAYESAQSVRYSKYNRVWTPYAKEISSIVKPGDRVYCDILSIRSLDFYWKYPAAMQTTDFEAVPSSGIAPGSYVFINRRAVDWLETNPGMIAGTGAVYREPSFVNDIPAGWKQVWKKGEAVLFRAG